MAISNTSTWDVTTPDVVRRAGVSDVLYGDKENAPGGVPDPVTMPTAEEFTQQGKQIGALNKVCAILVVSIEFSGGEPFVHSFISPSSNLSIGDLTVNHIDLGQTQIVWPAAKLPSPMMRPTASLNGTIPGMIASNATDAHTVDVYTNIPPNDPADMPFTLTVY